MRCAYLREKILHVRARLERQRSAQLAIECVLDDDVENFDAVIDEDIEFLFGSFRNMAARKDRPMRMREAFGQAVPPRGGDDLLAAGAQDGDVLDEALAAHVETSGQFATTNGNSLGARIHATIRRRRLPAGSSRAPGSGFSLEIDLSTVIVNLSCQMSSLV